MYMSTRGLPHILKLPPWLYTIISTDSWTRLQCSFSGALIRSSVRWKPESNPLSDGPCHVIYYCLHFVRKKNPIFCPAFVLQFSLSPFLNHNKQYVTQ